MKLQALILVVVTFMFQSCYAGWQVSSPDKSIRIEITDGAQLQYSIFLHNKLILGPGEIGMESSTISNNTYTVTETSTRTIDEWQSPVVPFKNSQIHNLANELTITFDNEFELQFRAYNEGVAWRWIYEFPDNIEIKNEIVSFPFVESEKVWFPEEKSLISHYERSYLQLPIDSITPDRFCSLPVLVSLPNDIKIAITEADLYNYPCLFLKGNDNGNGFGEYFPTYVLESQNRSGSDRNEEITKEADYIASTQGGRSFPWRIIMIAEKDEELLTNDMVFLLSRKGEKEDFTWVKPGRVAWDWWNAWNIYEVDFEAGINTQTYKYYIDFAAKYGLEYIILDEGWSKTTDLYDVIPEIDLEEIIRYGKEKNVGVILWVLWKPLYEQLEILEKFEEMGVKGIKVDFMQRADQWMVEYYERIAKEAANHHLLVDFHGAFKPAGLRAAFPNVLSYEGVKGLENAKWSDLITPEHDVTLPFSRQLAGPMDYTPGAMINGGLNDYSISWNRPMSQGTRCHQVAMYVIYESGLQMFCDNPTNYLKNPETTDFMSQIPVTWDQTHVLHAKVGEYLALARRNGDEWYIGAMTNEQPRDMDFLLDFLPTGNYSITIMEDGINVDKNAQDFQISTRTITSTEKIELHMAGGGGWTAIIKPVE